MRQAIVDEAIEVPPTLPPTACVLPSAKPTTLDEIDTLRPLVRQAVAVGVALAVAVGLVIAWVVL